MGERSGTDNRIGDAAGAVVQAGAIHGNVHVHGSAVPAVIPRQLPTPPSGFTGRHGELAALSSAMGDAERGTVVVSAIGGLGGIGKTWLSLHWAYQHIDRFPDGQLYADLHGFDPSGQPTSVGVVVRGFLDALVADTRSIPVETAAQAALFRSLVVDRKMLILLDNARDTNQVLPLLPGGTTCAVLVTSRHRLTGLITACGARLVDLDVLPDDEAHALLHGHLSSRQRAEADAVAELLDLCAGLPLALRIVAARAQEHPDFPLSVFVDELRDASARLDALDIGDPSANLRAVLSCSYHALDTAAARVLALLGIAPGPDIGLPAAASLTGLSIDRVKAVLRTLETASLVRQHPAGRYRMHDLVRLHATEYADHDVPAEVTGAALRRIVDFYLHTAHAGDRLLNPQRDGIDVGPPAADCQPVRLTNGVAALDWFAAEHLCVLAAQRRAMTRGWYGRVWRLSRALDSFHYQRGHFRSHLASCLAGLAAADALADPACQTRAHRHLGNAYKIMGDPGEAGHHLANALAIAERIDDSRATAHALCIRAWQGDHQQGLADSTRALGLYRQLGDPVREGRALRMMGWFYSRLGQYPQARDACQRAIEMARGHPDRIGEGHALEVLGYVAHHSGDHAQALAIYHQVLALNHDLGNRRSDVTTLTYLGEVYLSIGRPTDARRVWQQAVAQCREQHRTAEGEELQRLLDTVVPRQRAS